MLKTRKAFRLGAMLLLTASVFSSCDDPELDALMQDYCDCISESRYDDSKHYECIEMMDSIKEKYKNAPRKILKVIEKTDECY